jgi:hypothetical protein
MLRGLEKWGCGYAWQRMRVLGLPAPRHIIFCVADHFEPFGYQIEPDGKIVGGVRADVATRDVIKWCKQYRQAVAGCRDDDGRLPQHTFFYPWDEYDPKVLDVLSLFCAQGYGEVEVHLHHRNDNAGQLQERLENCCQTYSEQHGLLGQYQAKPGYAFVHGNWCLCNSRPDGDWCGVAQELQVLRATGCYMDCTFPSAPSPTQPSIVNRIYYGQDPVAEGCGHRYLATVAVKKYVPEEGLLMVPGPLGFYWRADRERRRLALENGALTKNHPGSFDRFKHWCRLHIHVQDRPEWIFVKMHTHGLDSASREGVVGETARAFYQNIRSWTHAAGMQLHYVSAREMYNIVKAAEAGETGSPNTWRDYRFSPPPVLSR